MLSQGVFDIGGRAYRMPIRLVGEKAFLSSITNKNPTEPGDMAPYNNQPPRVCYRLNWKIHSLGPGMIQLNLRRKVLDGSRRKRTLHFLCEERFEEDVEVSVGFRKTDDQGRSLSYFKL